MTLMFERLIAATVFITIALAGASPGALADTDDAGAQKAILVTGASSGIGRATARAFGEARARVALVDVHVRLGEEAAAEPPGSQGEASDASNMSARTR